MPNDSVYRTVARDDFPAMLEIDRFARRSPHFEEIIARTEEHFWIPADPDYIDFGTLPPLVSRSCRSTSSSRRTPQSGTDSTRNRRSTSPTRPPAGPYRACCTGSRER